MTSYVVTFIIPHKGFSPLICEPGNIPSHRLFTPYSNANTTILRGLIETVASRCFNYIDNMTFLQLQIPLMCDQINGTLTLLEDIITATMAQSVVLYAGYSFQNMHLSRLIAVTIARCLSYLFLANGCGSIDQQEPARVMK